MVTLSAPVRRFTVADFERMVETGILTEDDQVELIDGQVVHMSPIGKRHGAAVDSAAELFITRCQGRAKVRVQGPVQIGGGSQVQPDLAVLRVRADFYASQYPQAEDVLLLIEVADASLLLDRNQKVPLYAREGVAEVWLVNLLNDTVEVFRRSEHGTYADQSVTQRGEEISPIALPDLRVRVDDLTGA